MTFDIVHSVAIETMPDRLYGKPSAKAPVIDPGDEAPFLVRGRLGERTTHEAA